jgi:hypothetical protein
LWFDRVIRGVYDMAENPGGGTKGEKHTSVRHFDNWLLDQSKKRY